MQETISADIETMQQYYQQDRYRAFVRPVALDVANGSAHLIHGFLGTPADMHGLAELTQSLGFHTEGPLVPGMAGEIDALGTMTAEHWWTTALAEWDRFASLHGGPRILVGYSMGGALALQSPPPGQPHGLRAALLLRAAEQPTAPGI